MNNYEASDTAANPLVSVGMAVYNGEKYIAKAIESVLAQTYHNIELIISDDASTDNTAAISQSYCDRESRIKYIKQNKNIGARKNYSYVLDRATGEYFQWLDQDDYIYSTTYLENMIRAIESGYDYVIPSVSIETWKNEELVSSNTTVMRQFEQCDSRIEMSIAATKQTAMLFYALFRISALRKHQWYLNRCEDIKHHHEGLFVHAISSFLDGVHLPSERFVYRVHGGNTSCNDNARNFTKCFQAYFFRSFAFIALHSNFSVLQRIRLLAIFTPNRTKYLIRSYLSVLKQFFMGSEKHPNGENTANSSES